MSAGSATLIPRWRNHLLCRHLINIHGPSLRLTRLICRVNHTPARFAPLFLLYILLYLPLAAVQAATTPPRSRSEYILHNIQYSSFYKNDNGEILYKVQYTEVCGCYTNRRAENVFSCFPSVGLIYSQKGFLMGEPVQTIEADFQVPSSEIDPVTVSLWYESDSDDTGLFDLLSWFPSSIFCRCIQPKTIDFECLWYNGENHGPLWRLNL